MEYETANEYKMPDSDLIVDRDHGSYDTSTISEMSERAYIERLGECVTNVCRIQHGRMFAKGFYDTFWMTRRLIEDKINKIDECIKLSEYEDAAPLKETRKAWEKVLREHTVNFIIKQVGLIHEEGGEGSSAVREGNKKDDKLTDHLGIAAELADILIRAFDLAGFMGIDLGAVLVAKIGYNKSRPYMHGKEA